MKFFLVLALVAAASAASVPQVKFTEGSDDSARVAALSQIIQSIINSIFNPISVGPALVETPEPIQVGPAVVPPVEGISVGPAIVQPVEEISIGPALVQPVEEISIGPALVQPVEEISIGPALVQPVEEISIGPALVQPVEEISVGPALVDPSVPAFNPFALNGPLVQVVVNVDSDSSDVVSIEQPALIPAPGGDFQQIKPDPVIVVDNPQPAIIEPETISIGTPIFPETAANLPEQLN